jgi:cytochrome c-type biogenesis protein CcmH/NrfF
MKIRSGYRHPSTRSNTPPSATAALVGDPVSARSGFRLAAQTPPERLNLKLEARNSKLRIAQVVLIALLAITFLGADTDARFNRLGHGLMCMCGCNQILLECNHVGCTYSERMRNELSAGIDRGDSDSLVLQSFVQKYGNTVLAAPTTTGFNRVAWIMPFAVFAGALALTILLVRMWKSRAVAHPVPPSNLEPAELDDLRKKARQETDY